MPKGRLLRESLVLSPSKWIRLISNNLLPLAFQLHSDDVCVFYMPARIICITCYEPHQSSCARAFENLLSQSRWMLA